MSIKENIPEEISEAVQDVKESLPVKASLVDKLLGKLISRKLTVFLTATGLLVWSSLDPETWGLIAICYIGGQSVIDATQVWRHGKS
tara:strand:- start:82 stop:342 length:261 start_codon:yes stop_codon:yes gene_type:complete